MKVPFTKIYFIKVRKEWVIAQVDSKDDLRKGKIRWLLHIKNIFKPKAIRGFMFACKHDRSAKKGEI